MNVALLSAGCGEIKLRKKVGVVVEISSLGVKMEFRECNLGCL